MLVNVGAEERGTEEIFNRPRQVTASLIFCFLLVAAVLYAVNTGAPQLQKKVTERLVTNQPGTEDKSNNLPQAATGTSRITRDAEDVAGSLYRYASLPFEIASVLLLVAIIGSVMLARTLRQERSADDVAPEELEEELREHPEIAEVPIDSE
jgi:NADH-quinone oxidoreductase subunit J